SSAPCPKSPPTILLSFCRSPPETGSAIMSFETDKLRYMFTTEPAGGSGIFGSGGGDGTAQPVVPIHLANEIEPLLMGPAYFAKLKAAIDALPASGNPILWLAGWWFTPLFSLDAM